VRRTLWLLLRDSFRNFHYWLTGPVGIFLFYSQTITTALFGKPGERVTGTLSYVKWIFGGGLLAVFFVGLGYSMLKTIHAMRDERDSLRKRLETAPVLGLFFRPSDPACKTSDRTNPNFWEEGILRVGVTNSGGTRAERVRLVIARTAPLPSDMEVLNGYQLRSYPHDERKFTVQHDSGGAPSVYVDVGLYKFWRESGDLSLDIGNVSILIGRPEIKLLLRLEHERGSVHATLVLSSVDKALSVRLSEGMGFWSWLQTVPESAALEGGPQPCK